MRLRKPTGDRIIDVIYKKISGEVLSEADELDFRKWMRSTSYNRALMEDISRDESLRSQLIRAYDHHRNAFWKIILTYRTALHDGMPARPGNFWQRIFSIGKLFRRQKR